MRHPVDVQKGKNDVHVVVEIDRYMFIPRQHVKYSSKYKTAAV